MISRLKTLNCSICLCFFFAMIAPPLLVSITQICKYFKTSYQITTEAYMLSQNDALPVAIWSSHNDQDDVVPCGIKKGLSHSSNKLWTLRATITKNQGQISWLILVFLSLFSMGKVKKINLTQPIFNLISFQQEAFRTRTYRNWRLRTYLPSGTVWGLRHPLWKAPE